MDTKEIKHWIATNRLHDMYMDSEVKSLLNWCVSELAAKEAELEFLKGINKAEYMLMQKELEQAKRDRDMWEATWSELTEIYQRDCMRLGDQLSIERKRADDNEKAVKWASENMACILPRVKAELTFDEIIKKAQEGK